MIIKRVGNQLELTSKDSKAVLGEKLQLGDLKVPNNGEYEVGGILAHCISKNACLLLIESIAIAYMDFSQGPVSDQALEQLTAADVAIYKVSTESGVKAAASVSAVDPRLVIAFDGEGLPGFFKQAGLTPNEVSSLRLAGANLPQTEREAYIIK